MAFVKGASPFTLLPREPSTRADGIGDAPLSRGFPRSSARPVAGTSPPETRKLDACVVHAGGLLGIVGESYRQDELRALAGQTSDATAFREDLVDYAAEVADSERDRRWFMAVLVREPDNPEDPNAIAVYAQAGGKVGYLRREDARRYGQVFESLEKRGYEAAACPAMLTGGDAGESYGVVLAISSPGYVLPGAAQSAPARRRRLARRLVGCQPAEGRNSTAA